jgi:hypothetical protein
MVGLGVLLGATWYFMFVEEGGLGGEREGNEDADRALEDLDRKDKENKKKEEEEKKDAKGKKGDKGAEDKGKKDGKGKKDSEKANDKEINVQGTEEKKVKKGWFGGTKTVDE